MKPFNPLDKNNLGASVAKQLLDSPLLPLPPDPFSGAGVYAIYYLGLHLPYTAYSGIAINPDNQDVAEPIYVGKAIPAGARKGRVGLNESPGAVLYKRLKEHAESIRLAKNLDSRDFQCKYLTVDDIWIPLAESVLIGMFSPIWNQIVGGFGNHAVGKGRGESQRSAWDILHPGRLWADGLKPHGKSEGELIKAIQEAVIARKS